ncbi:unnamed protein product [Ostreobium quekettii]|uniref:S-acyltransferase n=1 Tax=Ostreobium quekettii TaxID=121088 RepID=A0A8S1JCC0_9CHLO|nr:unnamed protein product [Ostreobium quekettii]|eukprot:evm.model.scf_1001EXC.5 EVM.evm.TU.scf_1001EXC.5   scf_1001EXC:25035-29404(+)
MPAVDAGNGMGGMGRLAWMNVFRFCKALRVLGHVMVLAVLALVGLSFYAVAVETLGRGIAHGAPHIMVLDLVLLVVFSTLVFMLVWSYFAAVLTEPGSVPEDWHPFADDETATRELQRWNTGGDTLYDRADPQRPRYCRKCHNWKPERAHHCSVSGRCILKMDHYCIWVVNCVGLLNYKFFLLFIAYTWAACLLAACILMPGLVEYFRGEKKSGSTLVFLSFVIDAAFVVSLLGFLGMHLKLLSVNCTSIEMYEKQRIHPWPYNKGWRSNFDEVFGPSWWQWLLPFHTEAERQRMMDTVLAAPLIERVGAVEDV